MGICTSHVHTHHSVDSLQGITHPEPIQVYRLKNSVYKINHIPQLTNIQQSSIFKRRYSSICTPISKPIFNHSV